MSGPSPIGSSGRVGTSPYWPVRSCVTKASTRGCAGGFATYFEPGKYLDHWVVEHRHPTEPRWVRTDAEILGFDFVAAPDDLVEGEFLSGGEAWTLCRERGVDPMDFGVPGYPHAWGI